MKSRVVLLNLLILIWLTALYGQGTQNVPAAVKTAFSKRYPNQEPTWTKQNNEYVARYTEHGKIAIVHFNKRGFLTQQAWYILFSELPEATVVYLNKYYPKESSANKFTENLKCESRNGTVTYKVSVDGRQLVFNAKGIIVKKQMQGGHKASS